MNILMTYHGEYDINSGASGSMATIGRNLANLGHQVDFFTHSDLPNSWGRRTKFVAFPFWLSHHIARRAGPWDLLDACTGDSWVVGMFHRARPKIVIRSSGLEHMDTERYLKDNPDVSLKSRLYWFGLNLKLVESSLRTADHIIALTYQEKSYIESRFSIQGDKISVIHHVLPEYFRDLPKRSSPEIFKILFVSSWIEKKGIEFLVQALERFEQEGYPFQVTLAGVKVEESAIREVLSPALSCKVKVISTIEHRALPEIYLSHSVFVFPSLYEGFGKVLTEAMAAGLPVITTEAGVAQELIKHEENGIVIPYRDTDAIYQALCLAYSAPERMQHYGEAAKLLINSLDFDSVYQRRLTLYGDLLSASSSSRTGRNGSGD